jgi:hypothetical protein
MIVTYEARYEEKHYPKLCKVVSSNDTENEIVTSLNLSNKDEVPNISDDVIWNHMSNLLDYMKVAVQTLSLVAKDTSPDEGWPIIGWPEIDNINSEVTSWWTYLMYRDEQIQIIHNVGM